jgi:hypothetical protein
VALALTEIADNTRRKVGYLDVQRSPVGPQMADADTRQLATYFLSATSYRFTSL